MCARGETGTSLCHYHGPPCPPAVKGSAKVTEYFGILEQAGRFFRLYGQVPGLNRPAIKDGGVIIKIFGGIRRIEQGPAAFAAASVQVGMALQVMGEAPGNHLPLGNEPDPGGDKAADFVHQQGVMGACQYDGVNCRRLFHEQSNVFLDEIISPRSVVFIVFHQRNPHGTGLLVDLDIRKELFNLDGIGTRLDRAAGGQDPYPAAPGKVSDDFGGRTDHPQHPVVRVDPGQVRLLNGPKGFCRSGIAGQYHQGAAHLEEPFHALQRIAVDRVKGTAAVGSPGIIAEVNEVMAGQQPGYFL